MGYSEVSRPTALEIILTLLVVVLFVFAVVVAAHAWNDYQNSTQIEFRNATDERLCYVWGGECTAIKPNASSYGDWGSCPARVAITTSDGQEIYSRVVNCGEIDLADLFVLINQRDGEFVVLDNAPSN